MHQIASFVKMPCSLSLTALLYADVVLLPGQCVSCHLRAEASVSLGSLTVFPAVLRQSGLPTRKVKKKIKVDTSKFMTPYLAHSQKMLEQFSHVSKASGVCGV